MKIYTRTGDAGQTGLVDGSRVSKDDVRIDAYGTLDELNAIVGLVRAEIAERVGEAGALSELDPLLYKIQNELFVIGSRLATPPGPMETKIPPVQQRAVDFLEKGMDILSEELPPLTQFILPGGSHLSAQLHMARTVCRRAERLIIALNHRDGVEPLIIKYVNRLSDFLFIAARWVSKQQGAQEIFWQK